MAVLAEPVLPQVFGRYVLVKLLSRGGMGEIFLGRVGEIQGFEKPVIIKKVLPNLAVDEEFVKRFIDEAQVAIKLSHANIASVFEVGKVEQDYFLALEYIQGRDVRRLLNRLRQTGLHMPPDLCLYVAREVASGLSYAHRRTDVDGRALSLVHCDISPPNVMVSFEGEVKIIDFGIAKSVMRISGSNPNMGFGKFGYMAPEQLVRGGVIDRRTDIYAAGVVLYELLTGERLHVFPEGADYRQIARIVTAGDFIPPSERRPGLDPSLDPLVCKALASDPDDRYQTAEEFRDAVQPKLYQMNPTISADTLSEFVRGLFEDEISEERALLESTQSVDLAGFRDQVSGSVMHTVTFARAGLFGGSADGVHDGNTDKAALLAAALASGAPVEVELRPRHTGLVAGLVAAAMIGGGVAAYFAFRPAPPPPRIVVIPPRPIEPRVIEVKPPTTEQLPVVTPPPVIPPVTPPPTKRDPDPTKTKRPPTGKPLGPDGPETLPPSAASRTPEEVTAKFRSVKAEYDAFKGEYGGRLETQWTAIVNEITFGKADKYEKVNHMLDVLRRDMERVRQGS